MKDKPLTQQTPSSSIPVISPVLHCLAMPSLVFLRHSFGYTYMRPKKILLASVIITAGFVYAVWNDPALSDFRPLAVFAALASSLYLAHLIRGVGRLTKGDAEHDQYSGNSLLLAFFPAVKRENLEGFVHCIAEPILVIAVGYLMPNPLGKVLVGCGAALGAKELIRAWLSLRFDKALSDNLADATEKMKNTQPSGTDKPLSANGRTPREYFKPNSASD